MFWGKHHVGMITDDKLVTAADMAGASPLLGPVVFGALFERTIENGDGTFRGFQPRVLAYKFRVKVQEVERLIAAFVELGIVAGERLVNWAKRQGAAAAAASAAQKMERTVSKATERVRRFRATRREAARQGDLFGRVSSGVSPVTPPVSRNAPPAPPYKDSDSDSERDRPFPLLTEGEIPQPRRAGSTRAAGINPRALGSSPRSREAPPRETGRNPRATGQNPRALSTNPNAVADWNGRALQGEILMPFAGGRRLRPTVREQRQAEFRERLFRVAMRMTAEGANGVAA